MHEVSTLALAPVAGLLLGAIFFGGLWWTIRRGVSSERPAAWFAGSLLLRLSVTVAGFYFVAGGDAKRLLLCLVGFVVARLVVTRLTRPPGESRIRPAREASRAPQS
jgi:F1F0 ATPase subunit 2